MEAPQQASNSSNLVLSGDELRRQRVQNERSAAKVTFGTHMVDRLQLEQTFVTMSGPPLPFLQAGPRANLGLECLLGEDELLGPGLVAPHVHDELPPAQLNGASIMHAEMEKRIFNKAL